MEREILKDFDVICVIPTGSQVFCTNCHDTDYIVVVKECGRGWKQLRDDGIDYFVRDEKTFEKIATGSPLILQGRYSICVPLAIKNGTVDGDFPIENYNWFDYKDNILTSSLVYLDDSKRKFNAINREACLKATYWDFANYFALLNNSLDFTAEQQEILQKCHDNELPRSYADDLYQKLLEMKNNL